MPLPRLARDHQPTEESREMVVILAANGIPPRIIARAIQTSVANLRRYYRRDLRDAHWQIEATMINALILAAKRGSWGAARYWLMAHSRNPKWRIAAVEAGMETAPGGGNTTITIRGGLPDDLTGDDPQFPLPQPDRTNGAGTDPTH
jgi:hypothetical protein